MDLQAKNATQTPSVFTDDIRLSTRQLEEIIHKTVKQAIEEREALL